MSKNNTFAPDHLRVVITVPFGETINVFDLNQYLKSISPQATLDVENSSYATSVLFRSSRSLSFGEDTTSSQESNLRRAYEHVENEALEASLALIVEELDQPYKSEPDRETLGTETTRIVQ